MALVPLGTTAVAIIARHLVTLALRLVRMAVALAAGTQVGATALLVRVLVQRSPSAAHARAVGIQVGTIAYVLAKLKSEL